ncbi:MAG: M81 family metallopeptidase [Bryobacterales bacterium]|nr:M81 family metallopeptidase [Acidobacteriota bacterium]MCB9383541.1 M81 family metallopeptidase [Bryobacterales bacterium]
MRTRFRVGLLGLLHESNTFLSTPTGYEQFASTDLTRGAAVAEHWRGRNHEIGGMLAGIEAEEDAETVPLYATYAVPSGTITSEAFERMLAEMFEELDKAGPLDGLLVGLHGATVSEAYPDADGEILERLRRRFPRPFPIVGTLDLHANVSRAMIDSSDALVAYRSNPHLDQRERGLEAAGILLRTLRGEIRPMQWLEQPPLLIAISKQHTGREPAALLYQDLATVLERPGVLSASVAMGFYYADVAEMGVSFWVVADGDAEIARREARWMAERAWVRRKELVGELPDAEEAVRMAVESPAKPVVLMDVGDNVGGGSPGDSTFLLEELLRRRVANFLVVLCDPEAVGRCVAAGVRGTVTVAVGAKADALHGRPQSVTGTVRTLSDGRFEETEVRHGGWKHNDQGVTAVLETAGRQTIVLTSRRMAPFSLQQILSLGVQPQTKDVIVVKGVIAPRAAYDPIAGWTILVDTGGVTADSPGLFRYARRRESLYPLELDAGYEAEG